MFQRAERLFEDCMDLTSPGTTAFEPHAVPASDLPETDWRGTENESGRMKPTGNVQVTADALASLRVSSALSTTLEIECPYDHLFANDAGAALVNMALAVDPVYEQYNVVRYKHFSERMAEAASRFDQLLILGAGCDTRAMTLPVLSRSRCRVFEVDLPAKIEEKRAVFAKYGIGVPDYLRLVPSDLGDGALLSSLTSAGYCTTQPVAIFMEGVSFFLQTDIAALLLEPTTLALCRDSRLMLDCWTAARTQALNAIVEARAGKTLFGESLFGHTSESIKGTFQTRGFEPLSITSLGQLCKDYGVNDIADPLGDSWFVIEAHLE